MYLKYFLRLKSPRKWLVIFHLNHPYLQDRVRIYCKESFPYKKDREQSIHVDYLQGVQQIILKFHLLSKYADHQHKSHQEMWMYSFNQCSYHILFIFFPSAFLKESHLQHHLKFILRHILFRTLLCEIGDQFKMLHFPSR